MARRILQAQGYAVLTAANGLEALQVVNQQQGPPIQLVVTDVVMPQMGGLAMAEWLKATDPALKILFTSGYTDEAIAQHGVLDAGMAFLPKPYTPALLANKVRAMLDGRIGTEIFRKAGATNLLPNLPT
jgi:CheY-like chemotaxis protein